MRPGISCASSRAASIGAENTDLRAALLVTALLGPATLVACGRGGTGADATPGDGSAPSAPQPDSFHWTGNTRLKVLAAKGLLANDPPGTAIASADAVGSEGGLVTVDVATGAFTYDPPVGLQNAADTFTYRVTGFAPVTVTVNLGERVWYVNNDHAGADQGNDRAPFHTLAQAEAASDDDDVIFVFAGNTLDVTDAGQDRGIALKPGQRLLGEGVGLRLGGVPIVDPVPNARISNRALAPGPGGAPVVTLTTRNEVAGFDIETAFDEAILALGGAGHDLHDNTITFAPTAGSDGIRLLNVTGRNVVARNTITGSPRDGIEVANDEDQDGSPVAPTPVVATIAMSRNTITGSAHDGISVHLDGAGTDVTLNVLTNTVAASGTEEGDAGIEVEGRGAASVKAVLSRNGASGSAGRAIALGANGTSSVDAFVANNALSASGAATDFRASISSGSTAAACLELIANRNGAVSSTFQVESSGGSFQLFEPDLATSSSNDTPAVRQGQIEDVTAGACAVPLDGAALFEANCGHCHTGNGLGRGHVARDITGATVARILAQLAVNPTMSGIRLTQQEIQAIAGALAP